jgi:hypothetical protein
MSDVVLQGSSRCGTVLERWLVGVSECAGHGIHAMQNEAAYSDEPPSIFPFLGGPLQFLLVSQSLSVSSNMGCLEDKMAMRSNRFNEARQPSAGT